MDKYRVLVGVHLILIDARDRVLLGRRRNTGFGDGLFHVPAGHLEAGETAVAGLIREAREEIGVEIEALDVAFAHVSHSDERVQMFFVVRRWTGTVVNCEPEKCSELGWFEPAGLPDEIVDYCRVGIGKVMAGEAFSEYGWESARS
ncbi:NUDIX hydrolase [Nocardia alba]|uniref:ADP-ribose pyrophosphatase YjhB (NUDIX family) n=1 Tax=Nocardia alba TaxID=225051 RepID=A0A4R1FYK8_9NOCA|nr:NUDIX domain-containing protein [Nocardia alba]TCJ99280.1 ADP-ribose pyrophosphatase YjhB (NUDIX family) [Nocardia alba]